MSNRRKRIFFFSMIVIVSLLFYFLGRKHSVRPEVAIAARKTSAEGCILVEKVLKEQDNKELQKIVNLRSQNASQNSTSVLNLLPQQA